MAYGNASAGRQVEEAFVPYRHRRATKLAGTLATRIWKGNILVHATTVDEGVQNAADTATFILAGIAADSQNADAAAGDLIEVYPRGSVLWLPTLDTVTKGQIDLPCYVDYGSSGTPQLVTIGTAGANGASNQLGMVGVVVQSKTGYYLVDTTLMGLIWTDASLNFEIT